jgi:ABC-type Fe3+ transport system permease subunit
MRTSVMFQSLSLATLIAVLVVAVIAYLLFLRKRSNRHPVEKPELAGRSMAPKHDERST